MVGDGDLENLHDFAYRVHIHAVVQTHNTGCEFESSTCHNKNTISEEGNGKSPHEIKFLKKDSEPCLWFLLRVKSSM